MKQYSLSLFGVNRTKTMFLFHFFQIMFETKRKIRFYQMFGYFKIGNKLNIYLFFVKLKVRE